MKKKAGIKRPMRLREKLLIIFAIVICTMGAYTFTRIKAKENEVKLFRDELVRLQGEVSKGSGTRVASRELEDAQEGHAAAKAALDKTKNELADFTQNLVNVSSSDAVESVMLELTAIAARHGVNVQQTEPFTGRVAGMPSPKDPHAAQPLAMRPMRKIVLAGRFADITAFLDGIKAMRQTVQVLSFALRVGDAKGSTTDSPRLAVEMVVLL